MLSRRAMLTAAVLAGTTAGAAAWLLFRRLPPLDRTVRTSYAVEEEQFVRTVGQLFGPPLVQGNRITTLVNGDAIFPAMLDAIAQARQTITFETFIYWEGSIGQAFADALSRRARAGVMVHVIIDAVGGSEADPVYMRQMRRAGVNLLVYKALKWHRWRSMAEASRVNHRTHRKLLVVDGRVGFIGGVGVGDEWRGHARGPHEWRDNHYQVEGPVVAQLQAAFVDNWIEGTGRVLHGPAYFPALEPAGDTLAQVLPTASDGGNASLELMYLLSIAAARRNIRIGTAYFVPDVLTRRALCEARQRGVQVQILAPGRHTDYRIVRHASRARWGSLLRAGVEIYEYQPTMYHCKLLVVDDLWVSVGSANFDCRSFDLNDEANLNVYDADFAAEQNRLFEQDLARSRRVTLVGWRCRPAPLRFMERAASALGAQL